MRTTFCMLDTGYFCKKLARMKNLLKKVWDAFIRTAPPCLLLLALDFWFNSKCRRNPSISTFVDLSYNLAKGQERPVSWKDDILFLCSWIIETEKWTTFLLSTLVLLIKQNHPPSPYFHNIRDGQQLSYVWHSQQVSVKLTAQSKHTKMINLQLPVLQSS